MASRKGKKRSGSSRQPQAIAMLMDDHRKVQKLFKQFEKTEEHDEQERLATEICNELSVHADLEEQVFYPAARDALEEADLIEEAEVEHHVARDLIERIRQSRPQDGEYCAMVTVLGEYVNHHIREEEKELLPQVKKSDLDLESLGEDMLERKHELREQMGLETPQGEMAAGAMRPGGAPPSRSRSANR
jgi:hemerythrin-like domain-containing protein